MPTISANTSTSITIAAGSRVKFSPTGQGLAILGPGAGAGTSISLGATEQTIGPFDATRAVYVSAIRALDYVTQPPPFDAYQPDGAKDVVLGSDGTLKTAQGEAVSLSSAGLGAAAYDGSNKATSFTFGGVTYTVTYPAGQIVVTGSDGSVQTVTLDGSSRIQAVN